ncbi:MAG: hypothetical protein CL678_13535 [Bdellovibrionaceae bacterium]|nr:hypothetical protein [Pseudobdellovibrionaceae bacterium]|tara:strand:+ start:1764 stop:2675 length:912 start_codon:yes stop_codon:yes gene_type:complete
MILNNNKGQSQILMAAAFGIIMLSGAVYTLQRSEEKSATQTKIARISEMRAALDGAVQFAQQIYQNESGCDPAILQNRLNRLNTDGTFALVTQATTRRQLDMDINRNRYRVSFGPVINIEYSAGANPSGPNSDTPGMSQDVELEVWTTDCIAGNGNCVNSRNRQRVVQRAVLLNNCTHPCVNTLNINDIGGLGNIQASGICVTATDPNISYHEFVPGEINGFLASCPTNPGIRMGDANGDDNLNVLDLELLRNYLRNQDSSQFFATLDISACMDMNQDQIVNEIDLALLEKLLRGYIYRLPIR